MTSYLFDVDGTLTEPMRKMETGHAIHFIDWMKNKSVYIVAGGDKERIYSQVPNSILVRSKGVFCCMANEFWRGTQLIYKNEFEAPVQLKEMLISYQMYTKFPIKPKIGGRGEIFQFRTGMVNFTTIGRNAGVEERNKYYEWDKEHGERKEIAKNVEKSFPYLEARLGGQISIDIQPIGNNKSLASKWIRDTVGGRMVFYGDKMEKGGNDYDLSQDILSNGDGECYKVNTPNDTMSFLI